MLKLIQVQARLEVKAGKAHIRQMSPANPEDLRLAQEIIQLYTQALGQSRQTLEQKIEKYSGARLDYREIDGLAKVIEDAFATFTPDSLPFNPSSPETLVPETGEDAGNEPEEAEDEEQSPYSALSRWRLEVWKQAAKPENYPFANAKLIAQVVEEQLGQGVKMRRVSKTEPSPTLESEWLLPPLKRVALMQTAAENCGYNWDNNFLFDAKPEKILFNDLPARHRLSELHPELTAENLLNRYNIELLRGALYLAPRIKIIVRDRYKDLFKYIKFFGLMHTITPVLDKDKNIEGYEIILEGAASPFLARTDRRYGIRFAQFLPAMFLCEADWSLAAELILADGQKAQYYLVQQPHLRTHFKGSGLYDSKLEESLAEQFEKRFNQLNHTPDDKPRKPKKSDARKGWTIKREDRLIPVYDTVMIPDFSFENIDGRRAMLEVVGFWEKSYLERKIGKLNRAGRSDIIVLVSERTRVGKQHFAKTAPDGEIPYQLIFFKGKPRLGVLLSALERCAVRETPT